MKKRIATAVLALATVVGLRAPARAEGGLDLPFERYTLPNGLEVILHQDKKVPIVTANVWYHVGSGDETPGKSGFAHLFEHMMFQGSTHTGKDKHFEILREIGSSNVNGTTNSDRTNYFEEVPSNQLETALWLESDRMAYMLPLLDETSLANQRDVVRNERRQRYDNVPYGAERFKIAELLYPEGHPYRYMTIGRHEDLAAASVDDVKNFFKKWYVPGNATLIVAGDFEPAEAKKAVEKWFGSFPKSERPKRRMIPAPATKHQRAEIKDGFAKLKRVHYVWHSPALFAAGDAELDLLGYILTDSGTGRLYKVLVHEKQLAQSVAAYQGSGQMSSSFNVIVDLKPGANQAEVEKILDEELAKVMKEPVTDRELARAKVNTEAGFIWGLEGLGTRADQLQTYNHYLGDPGKVAWDLQRYANATGAGIRDVAAKYLGRDARVEVISIPADEAASAGGGKAQGGGK